MARIFKRSWVALVVTALATAWAVPALAIDAPNWVAVLYVEGQKMVGLRWMPVPGATEYKDLRSDTAGSGSAEIATAATVFLRSCKVCSTSPVGNDHSLTVASLEPVASTLSSGERAKPLTLLACPAKVHTGAQSGAAHSLTTLSIPEETSSIQT